jgi:hypothetical protein
MLYCGSAVNSGRP